MIEEGLDRVRRGNRCSGPSDADQDLIADACDLCPLLASRETRNSNYHAEAVRVVDWSIPGYGYLADPCDPVPQFTLNPQPIPSPLFVPPQGAGLDGPRNVVAVQGRAIAGLEMVGLNMPGPVSSATLETGAQFCSCYDEYGTLLNDYECVRGTRRRCDVGNIRSPSRSKFKAVTLSERATPAMRFSSLYEEGAVQPQRSFEWRWFEAGSSIDRVPVAGDPNVQFKIGGVLASVIDRGEFFLSDRDVDEDGRVVLQHYEAPRFSDATLGLSGQYRDCEFVGCFHWLAFDPRTVMEPGDIRTQVTNPAILEIQGDAIQLSGRSPALVVEDMLSPTAKASLLDAADVWIPRAEPASWLLTSDAQKVMGVALTHNGALGSTPRRLLFSEGLLDADASTTPTNDTPPLLDFTLDEGELAAYSANWDAVFFAGGPTMSQQLRRFDLASGKWSFVLEDQLALGQTVLGLALDVPSAQVYLLHVPDALGAEAALVRVDLRTQSVDALATFAYGGDAKQLSLRTTESGALILTRADANGFDVWRLDVSGASMSVAGHSRISAAELLDLPLVVGETLHAPVRPASGEDTILDIALDALQDSASVSTL